MAYMNKKAGRGMRELRDQLGLTMRDVHGLTRKFGKQHRNSDYIVSPSRLSDIEKHGHTPNLYRLHALALAYRCKAAKLLKMYGIN
ncbi:MAG TPA: helix-turn-helix transcriptional regulator [Terriglobales bacterium]|nr:helix-turn-helix transcriptional regulator [Terriglobales bacterium]